MICGRVLDASNVADFDYCDTTSILRIRLKTEKLPQLKRETNFSMNLLLDDTGCPSSSVSPQINYLNYNQSPTIPCTNGYPMFFTFDGISQLEFQNNYVQPSGTLQFAFNTTLMNGSSVNQAQPYAPVHVNLSLLVLFNYKQQRETFKPFKRICYIRIILQLQLGQHKNRKNLSTVIATTLRVQIEFVSNSISSFPSNGASW